MINRKNIPDNNGIFDQNVSNSKFTDQSNKTILEDEGTYGSISSNDNTNTQNRLNNAPLINLENSEDGQKEQSDEDSSENPKENKNFFKNIRNKVSSVFAKDSDNEDSSSEMGVSLDDRRKNVSDHSEEETSADQLEDLHKNSSENSDENRTPFKNFRKKIRPASTKDTDNDVNFNETDATLDDTQMGNASDHSNEEMPTDQQENSDIDSPRSPKEKRNPFKNFRNKVQSVFTKDSDNEDSSNEMDATPDARKGNVSDQSDEETPTDQQEDSDKNSPRSPKESRKLFKNFRKKIRPVFTKDSDNEVSSNEMNDTPDVKKGDVSGDSEEETPSDNQGDVEKNSPENPSGNRKLFKNFREKVRSAFTKDSDNEDSSNEMDSTFDNTTTGNVSDQTDEETSTDQHESSDINSPGGPKEKRKPFNNLRNKVRSVFAKDSDNEDSSKEIDATVDDSTTGNISDHNNEETSSDQHEHSDRNSPENSNENKPSKSFRHKIRSVFAKGSDDEDSSKEIDATVDDSTTGNISDHSDEETSSDQHEHSDINSPKNSNENKPSKSFRHKIRSVFAKGSDNEDSSKEMDSVLDDTQTGNVSDHSDEETPTDQQENSDIDSPRSPKEKRNPFKNFRNKVQSVFAKDSDNEDSSNEIDATSGDTVDVSDGETLTDQERLDKTSPESPNEKGSFTNFRNKLRSVFTKDSTNEDSSSEIDNTPEETTSNVSSANDRETSERNGKSDKNKAVDNRVFDRHFNDPDKSITFEASNDTQNLNAALHSVNRGTLKSNKDIVGVTKEKPGNNTKNSSFRTKNGKTVEATENFQPSSKVALVDSTLPVDQYMTDAAEVQKCPPIYAKPNIKSTILEPSTEQYPENEEFQSESSSPENKKRDKYNNDSIVDLLDKLDPDPQKASDEESTDSKSNLNSPETESDKKSSPSRSTSFSRFRTKLSSMFSFKSDKKKNDAKEKEEASDVRNGDENDGDGTADRKDGDDSSSILDKSEPSDGDDTTIRRDVLKPVKNISTHSPNINSKKKIERRQSDKTLSEDSEEELSKEERSHDREDIITGESDDNEYNPFDKFYNTNKGKHLTGLAPTNSNVNDLSSDGIQGIDEDKYYSDGKKTSNLNSTSSSPSTFYKTPPPYIPSKNIQEDSTIYQKPNNYNESEDNDSLFESSSLYTSSQLSESEFPPEQKDNAESTTPPMSSEADNKENAVKKTVPWYNKFRALFSLKKPEKTPVKDTTTDDGEFSRAESYHPKMLDTDGVDLDTVSNSPNWSDIIDDDVVSEDVQRKLAAQNSKLIFNNDGDSFVQTKPKLNSTENISRSTSFPDTEDQRTSSKLPTKGQSLDQDNTLQEGNSLKRWPHLGEITNVADNPMFQQEYPLSSERSTSNEYLSDDSLETEQKVQTNIDRNPLTQSRTLNAETFLDSTNSPKTVVASKKSSKVPIRVKKASFSGNKRPVLSPSQSRLFDYPNNEDTIKDSSKGTHLRKDGNDRTSTVSGNESNIMIKKRAKEPITLETSNAHLVRRSGRSPTETKDRRDVKKQVESKYKPIGDQAADGRRVLPKGGKKTKTTSYADSLDENLLTEIFSFLDQKTLIFTLPLVCKKWKRASCHPSLWQLVAFSHGRMTTNFLEKFSQRFTNLRELCFDNIQGRPKRRGESEKFYQKEIQGSLEQGLETVLISAEGSLQKLTITNCGPVFTERSLWLVSCYARLLEEFTYHSALHPPTAEVLWALASGCRDITKLDLSPINPRSPQQERFNNKCANLIAKGYPSLKSISIGGCGIDNQGLLLIAQQCQDLEELELNQFMADFNESSAKKLCKRGLHNLESLKFTHTPVQSETIQVFMKNCPNLKNINVQVKMQDYFSDSENSKFKQQYRFILIKLKSLKAYPKLDKILELDIRDNK
ncbi:probable WRKY transcription factor protein 1 isoform X1 [Octopus sinensis]|uniref:Probable WRKY transcription factor protein 1 isoform X1 n=2 Tax=Octopus sinensis TaxID=2607531 RepID=A0A7E6ENI5_9MOLL|nr:probable WRKY transcription factor protein 1 isoform X1 [Octopus sinensis]